MAEITYRMENGYRLPNLLPPQEPEVHLGKYALLRRKFLKQNRRVTYTNLLTSGKLNAHLAEIEQTAQGILDQRLQGQDMPLLGQPQRLILTDIISGHRHCPAQRQPNTQPAAQGGWLQAAG